MMDSTEASFLRDGDAVLEAIERCGVGIWRWKVDAEQLEWTRNLESIHRLPAGAFDGTLASFSRDIHPDDADRVWATIRETVETGQPYEVRYRTAPSEDGDMVWVHAQGAMVSDDGASYLTGTCQDITREVRSEQELRKRLSHLSAITELGSFALAEDNFKKVLDRAVEVAASMFEAPLTKILRFGEAAETLELVAGHGWNEGLVGTASVGIGRDSQAGYTLASRDPVIVHDLRTEERFGGPPLLVDHGVTSGMSVVIEGAGDRPYGVFGVHDTRMRQFEATDAASLRSLANVVANAARQNEALRRQELLTQEIAHRSNNLLQVVSVIARQTFTPDAADPAAALSSFSERLNAISRANGLISQGGWGPTRLASVVEEVLLPYRERVNVTGRDILLPPQMCFDIGLVVHELATNSVKYGSLGSDIGCIAVAWKITEGTGAVRRLDLEWSDPKTRPESRSGSGFGRRLKSSLIEGKWGGEMRIDLGDEYRFSCSIPLKAGGADQECRERDDASSVVRSSVDAMS